MNEPYTAAMKEKALRFLAKRLETYSGPHPNETWKLDKNAYHCTEREKQEMAKYGLAPIDFMNAGYNRGEIHHMLFGYRAAQFSKKKKEA